MKKVEAISNEQFVTEITGNNHTIIADEPKDIGGSDLGLRPTELLHAALASCSSITMRMYANRKEWDLGKIQVDVERIENEGQDPFLAKTIKIGGAMDEKQLDRLKFIASKCPIHKLLINAIDIQTEIS